MSTNDVPGTVVANSDVLSMGCWAENEDGSLIFVDSVEGGRVIYEVFDLGRDPIMSYKDAMPEKGFKKHFSWDPDDVGSIKWTWHDKTPFPWDKVIKEGVCDGPRYASADGLMTAAARVARSRHLMGQPVDESKYEHLRERITAIGKSAIRKIQRAIDTLKP